MLTEEEPKNGMVQSRTETALDLASFITSAVPWIGGPVSNVLEGISTGRKFDRVREVLEGVAEDLQNFRSEVSEQYVKTEQFEELLEETLKRTAGERAEEKRRVYRTFLSQSIKHPGEPYDEQLRVLRTLEQPQPAHLQVLVALDSEPDEDPYAVTGSPHQTLIRRLAGYSGEQIEELIIQLNELRVINLPRLHTMMTPRGASDLRHTITGFGRLLMCYISSR